MFGRGWGGGVMTIGPSNINVFTIRTHCVNVRIRVGERGSNPILTLLGL